MKDIGIVRKLDELGRVTIPKELRSKLSLNEKDSVSIYVDGDKIVLQKFAPGDIFTGRTEDLIDYHGKLVSSKSIREMAEKIGLI
ncbi:transcriptional pleiotropic regulator of transition state genes [Acetitomaculum ruminis DSM 5522]|uniref:Transcriptional pleiotropic regulator of transition state genes n=1 Tax=Acetitomaculum ruminis DSM 5522 TaxID=1120918 RepID=A0A1I0W7H7_9FIRM|nr:AbrB/MazE/SpoVT family DNA-binding domain-containing protein [Acetitomaculum ruminis]SFA84514.1 transcriptional pleiotropic regulator of transition state genes [Acetitomaculum ruminis DSM 5522]